MCTHMTRRGLHPVSYQLGTWASDGVPEFLGGQEEARGIREAGQEMASSSMLTSPHPKPGARSSPDTEPDPSPYDTPQTAQPVQPAHGAGGLGTGQRQLEGRAGEQSPD